MDLLRIAKNIDRGINELPSFASEILDQKFKKEVIEIQQNQLSEGIRGDGKPTQEYTSESYIKRANKQSAKSYPNRDYYNEGDFYAGMDTAANNDVLSIFSLDFKAGFLEPQEDNELLGIAPQNIEKIDNIKGFPKELINKVGYELSR